jgi:hypothetical protein
MKRFFIQLLAFSLISQPLLANPIMMQSMRSHQSMAAMRAVLNNQKENAGIFNKNVQKRHFIAEVVVTAETVVTAATVIKNLCAGATIATAIHQATKHNKKLDDLTQGRKQEAAQSLKTDTYIPFDDRELLNGYLSQEERNSRIPGVVYGFNSPGVIPGPSSQMPTPISQNTTTQSSSTTTAPSQNSVPSPSINPAALSNDEKDRQAAEAVVGGIIQGGQVAGKAVNKAAELVAALNPNPLETPGSSGGITMGDATGGVIAVGAAAEKTAEVVAHKTLWGIAKGVVGPYVQPVGYAIMSGADAMVTSAVSTGEMAGAAVIYLGKGAIVLANANPITATVIGATIVFGGPAIYDWWTTPAAKAPSAPVSPAVTHVVQQVETQKAIAAQDVDSLFPFELNEREDVKSIDSSVAKNQGGGGSGGTPNIDPEKDPEKKEIITRKDPLPTHNVSQMGHIFRKKDGHLLPGPESRSLLRGLVRDAKNFVLRDDFGRDWYAKVLENGSQLWAEVKNGYITNGGINEVAKACNRATGFKSGPKGI